ncbi:MACPF domain-containing protein NSL1 [Raphanus sativus]|uniref:MACPF domain-containing protein NSL1 n=1 Tax=Raphanus sativus TaxID=3726 RepID=A0A9W3CCH4_RAPSA|nr:MACPF domain-containing protein NSL1 [Raphanus sativus]KAJ4879890.1 MACPF domain-containing protein NSL1 [Raphanus sativus]
MAFNISRLDAQSAAEKAVSVIGSGYDLCSDVRLSACKPTPDGSRLVEIDPNRNRDLVFPGGVVVSNVSSSIKCDKGERTRFRSDILSFNQMSEKFNQNMSLSGKIPSGMFNTMFELKEGWQKDASSVKTLSYDGWFISLYSIELDRSQVTLRDEVKREVPSSWDSVALAGFIEKYGTHIVVGVTMGGKDVVHMKQLRNSNHEPDEVQKLLKQLGDKRFAVDPVESVSPNAAYTRTPKEENPIQWGFPGQFGSSVSRPVITHSKNEDLVSICIRRGGVDMGQSHDRWLSTISQSPNAISMCFVPITSLLSGLPGTGFLSHAVNLYLRYKPPIEELQQFLEFQLPRQWAPVYGDLPLGLRRRKQSSPSLQFSLMGPKLYVNTSKVDSGERPVTGLRLFLEGKKGDHLAIHLQHLSTCPPSLHLSQDDTYEPVDEPSEKGYYEAVKWGIFSHVCTFPVQYNGARSEDAASIVTKAWLEVKGIGMRKVLFLRLGFSLVASATTRKSTWDNLSSISRKSGVFSMISTRLSAGLGPNQPTAKPVSRIDINSAVYPKGPSPPVKPKLLSLVDMKEVVRGPEVPPGYWVVTGAKLCVEAGKISIKAKYSLLTVISEDSLV